MKTLSSNCFLILLMSIGFVCITSCNEKTSKTEAFAEYNPEVYKNDVTARKAATPLTEEFKAYWYKGEAEITSYKLEQARYGEIRQGNAVLVYVTEDFEKDLQVKADYSNPTNIPVLKLNTTKNFNTGIYPYSIMQSTFYPVASNQHATKVSCSVQEWCGHVYSQINNRDQFEFTSHSYFQSEADQNFKLDKTVLENQLWNQLRVNPESLPVGNFQAIPSLEFIRLRHVPLKAYKAIAKRDASSYSISYPELDRTLSITFNPEFPYDITGWTETFKSGFGPNAKTMTSKATKLKSIKSDYWNKNGNANEALRKVLLIN